MLVQRLENGGSRPNVKEMDLGMDLYREFFKIKASIQIKLESFLPYVWIAVEDNLKVRFEARPMRDSLASLTFRISEFAFFSEVVFTVGKDFRFRSIDPGYTGAAGAAISLTYVLKWLKQRGSSKFFTSMEAETPLVEQEENKSDVKENPARNRQKLEAS